MYTALAVVLGTSTLGTFGILQKEREKQNYFLFIACKRAYIFPVPVN